MKKKIIPTMLLAWALVSISLAQGGLLLNTVQFVADGGINIVIDNGKWKNTGSNFSAANSTIKFTGTATANNSTIEGDNTLFQNLTVAKTQNNLKLMANTTMVNGILSFSGRNIDLNGQTIELGTDAELSTENENSRTYSAMPLSRVIKTRNLNAPLSHHFGRMGVIITAFGNLGSTTVDRRHKVHTLPASNSIQKYWRFSVTNPVGQNATLRFIYFNAELNGLNESDLTVWRSTNNGASWTEMGFASRNSFLNYVEINTVSDLSGWWTLGEATPFAGPGDNRALPLTNDSVAQADAGKWRVFPNPAIDHANVELFSTAEQTVSLEVIGAHGKTLQTMMRQVSRGNNTILIPISDLPSGMYILRVQGMPYPPIRLVVAKTGRP